MSVEERILFLAESPDCNHPRELRAIALEVRKREDRIKQLEEELERTKQDRNAIAKNTREPLLWQLDHAAERIKRLEREVELLRLYGNKDCIAQADEVLKKEDKL